MQNDGSDFGDADLNCVNIQGGDWSYTNLRELDFSKMDLCDISFEGADLTNCRMEKGVIKDCRFCDANLTNVSFRGADLRGSDFAGVAVLDVNWEKAKVGLEQCVALAEGLGSGLYPIKQRKGDTAVSCVSLLCITRFCVKVIFLYNYQDT